MFTMHAGGGLPSVTLDESASRALFKVCPRKSGGI
jgi:hypothetical protein